MRYYNLGLLIFCALDDKLNVFNKIWGIIVYSTQFTPKSTLEFCVSPIIQVIGGK